MAKFVFELEAVLRQRERAERAQQRVVAEIERERLAIEDEIRACQTRIRGEKTDLAARLDGAAAGEAIDLRGVRFQANASLHLIATAQRAVLRLAAVHDRLDRARLVLLERAIDTKAMASLKERRREAWAREQARREAAELDEMTVMRHERGVVA